MPTERNRRGGDDAMLKPAPTRVMLSPPMRAALTDTETLRLAVLLERDGITAVARRANCAPNTLRAARGGRLLSGPTVTVLRHLLAPPPPARAA